MSIPLIGGIGLTLVTVYEQHPAPDGETSGSPHIHAVTDEAYYVVAGCGAAEFHDPIQGYRRVFLQAGQYLEFEPGILHRLVSTGGLQVLGLMANAGLTEAGDARIYFGKDVDEDPALYRQLWSLPRTSGLAGALERRDRAVSAYRQLLDLWEKNRSAYFTELSRFLDVVRTEAFSRRDLYMKAVELGPAAWAEKSRSAIRLLPQGALAPGIRGQMPVAEPVYGMCGLLQPILSPTALAE
jgi:mannose-6-phosphate isomerase-like protein (cupin superfamily)